MTEKIPVNDGWLGKEGEEELGNLIQELRAHQIQRIIDMCFTELQIRKGKFPPGSMGSQRGRSRTGKSTYSRR